MQTSVVSQIVLDKFWAQRVDSVQQGLTQLRTQLDAIDVIPQHIILASAGEVKPLLNCEIASFCQSISDNHQGEIDFISAACTSLHASILHFNQIQATSCLVLLLELDEPIQQGCLDSLGIGVFGSPTENQHNSPDGLIVKNSVGFCFLRKKIPTSHEFVISHCHIFSQPNGISGMQKLLKLFVPYLKQSSTYNSKIVAFDISSIWSIKLKTALDHRLKKAAQNVSWLASYETDHNHYLSLKPIFELQDYQQQLKKHTLSLLTLGGGGRVGYLAISTQHRQASQIDVASCYDCNLTHDTAAFKRSICIGNDSISDYHAMVKENLKYPKSQFRGINNHYFRWQYRGPTHVGIKQ